MAVATQTRTYQILLAEDSAADAGIVRIVLREHSLDHVLSVVRDGAAAIAFIENADNDPSVPRLDLLLLDMHLPKYDGPAILERLRSTEFHAHVPVVVMTSSDAPQDRDSALEHAAVYYFRKPSRLEEFRRLGVIVDNILAGKEPSAFGAAGSESKGGTA